MDTEKGSGIGFLLESNTYSLVVTVVGNNSYNTTIIQFLSLFLCAILKVTLTIPIISSQFLKCC